MWQSEVRVDLDAVRANVALLRTRTAAQIMAVVKSDGYGHGMVPCARAALEAGATWLGVATLGEALAVRAAGITAPMLSWLHAPGLDFAAGITANVDLSVSSRRSLDEIVAAATIVDRPARIHLKIDSGMGRGGAAPADWAALVEAAAKAQADGHVEIIGVWSHLASADDPDPSSVDRQLAAFTDGLDAAARLGVTPQLRHLANSAALLARPDTHFDLVRPGLAVYGLSPIAGNTFDLRPAMSVRARVALVKRVPAGQGVSYGQTYVTPRETTVALIPIGYADGVPRAASGVGPVALGGRTHTIAGRVCMDQFVLDVGDLPVQPGDVAVLFGGNAGDPHADEWAAVCDTINHEIVARMGSARVPRVYEGERGS
ncbi:alanine racemase [Virgisporangium aliadipatigenens]|uniref:Alanine racemase n=1 Tax=Virgisporangium aliadipatigenens TaxID=741659 RepID=A0A8J4DPS7_9ACTN|nr:alanine racemase [Virgisporangium aliadipatigenens]GIJ44727.1 alanine racemase [Virgisporangium aliadipatigenens]